MNVSDYTGWTRVSMAEHGQFVIICCNTHKHICSAMISQANTIDKMNWLNRAWQVGTWWCTINRQSRKTPCTTFHSIQPTTILCTKLQLTTTKLSWRMLPGAWEISPAKLYVRQRAAGLRPLDELAHTRLTFPALCAILIAWSTNQPLSTLTLSKL